MQKMSNFNEFVKIMESYLSLHGYSEMICSDMQKTSYNDAENCSLVSNSIAVIDMDTFAKKVYRKIKLPESLSEDDSINTVDAFLIDDNNEWYFIEFKDAKISNSTKASVLKKAYSNVYALLEVLYAMRDESNTKAIFNYDNPIAFFQNNVHYILVFRAAKNPIYVQQLRNHRLKNEKYLPGFMERLKGYIFKDAYAVTEDVFEHTFVKDFKF